MTDEQYQTLCEDIGDLKKRCRELEEKAAKQYPPTLGTTIWMCIVFWYWLLVVPGCDSQNLRGWVPITYGTLEKAKVIEVGPNLEITKP